MSPSDRARRWVQPAGQGHRRVWARYRRGEPACGRDRFAQRLLALALGALLCSTAACTKCRASGDCAKNQHCDYSTGLCLNGCTDGTQCSSGQCNTATGKCVPADLPDFDADVSMDARTATTSTTTDAGV